MSIVDKMKQAYIVMNKYMHIYNIQTNSEFLDERYASELVRNVHSIEKGLSLREVRPFFGVPKILEAYEYAKTLIEHKVHFEEVCMFIGALRAYIEYHTDNHLDNEKVEKVRQIYLDLLERETTKMKVAGGYIIVNNKGYSKERDSLITDLIKNRHSIREFDLTPIDDKLLLEAIDLARYCPSACNRQGFRVHIVSKENMRVFDGWFDGIGGFANEIQKMILVTGKISAYRVNEEFQYIVSASVFAGYLTMTLEAKNIGCCFVQRPLLQSKQWDKVTSELNIDKDEQIICALGIGNMLEEFKAPISHRINIEQIVNIH